MADEPITGELDVGRLRELLGEATPGPWLELHEGVSGSACQCGQVWSTPADAPVALCDTRAGEFQDGPTREQAMHNARAIAAAVNALPALLDRLEKAEGERDEDPAITSEVSAIRERELAAKAGDDVAARLRAHGKACAEVSMVAQGWLDRSSAPSALVDAITGKLSGANVYLGIAADRISALEASLREAGEALEPFAKAADDFADVSDADAALIPADGAPETTVADFRHARTTLSSIRGNGDA